MEGITRLIDINTLDEKTRNLVLSELVSKNTDSETHQQLPIISQEKKKKSSSSYYKSYKKDNESVSEFLIRRMKYVGHSVDSLYEETKISKNTLQSCVKYNHPLQKNEAWLISEELECHVKDLLPSKYQICNFDMLIARKKKNLTLSNLSNLTNINTCYLSNIENGKSLPGVRQSQMIEKILNVKFDNKLSTEENKNTEKLKGAKFLKNRRCELCFSIHHMSRNLKIPVERIEKLEKFGIDLKSYEVYRISKFLKCDMKNILTSPIYQNANWFLINRRYELNLTKLEISKIINYQYYLKIENNSELLFSLDNDKIKNLCTLFRCTEDDLIRDCV